MTEPTVERQQFNNMYLPPLGKIPEFDVAEEASELPYLRIDDDPQLAPAFQDLVRYTGEFQAHYGLPVTEIDPDSVHVLTAEK